MRAAALHFMFLSAYVPRRLRLARWPGAPTEGKTWTSIGEKLPTQEKYRIAATHVWILKDYPRAIESYENLAKVAPGAAIGSFAYCR